MDLRTLRQEIQELPSLEKNVQSFLQHWARPLRYSSNKLPSLTKTNTLLRKELHKKVAETEEYLAAIKMGQHLQEKLHSYIHSLIELKLTTFNGNKQKSAMILRHFLQDEVFNLKQTLLEQEQLEQAVQGLRKQYLHVNGIVQKHLSLEDGIVFSEAPHLMQLQNIIAVVEKQKKLLKQLGEHFVLLAKETRGKK